MIYKIKRCGLEDEIFTDVRDVEDFINDELIDSDGYDEYLDEICGDIHIGLLTYSTSQVLEAVDPIAYRCGLDDYIDSIMGDVDISMMEDGDTEYIDNMIIECVDDECDEVMK